MLKKVLALLTAMAVTLTMTSFVFASSGITFHSGGVANNGPVVGNATKVGITPYIASDGTFTFNNYALLTSDQFKITSTSISIYASATTTTTSQTYYITLYGAGCGLSGKKISYTANGFNYYHTFTGLTNGGTYQFEIIPADGTGRLDGSGSITNFGGVV